MEVIESKQEPEIQKDNLKPMERRKKRKEMDKVRHKTETKPKKEVSTKKSEENAISSEKSGLPGFHIDVFKDLACVDVSIRKSAAEKLTLELVEVQKAFERSGSGKGGGEGNRVMLEAEKDDGLENCAGSVRYAVRRLIRGVSSSRECARQGFALGLSVVLAHVPAVKVESLMKLIVSLLEISASTRGQEAKDCYLGRLFAYGSIATSGRLTSEWLEDNDTSSIEDFVSCMISLAGKKRYLREPAISIIVDVVEKLPLEAVTKHVLEAPGIKECFEKAANIGDPDALFFALKLQEKVSVDSEIFGKLLPYPFSPDNFFTRDHLLFLSTCFKESTFCHPRLHSLWQLLVNILVPTIASQDDAARSNRKHKKSRKGSSNEEFTKNIRSFCEVVIEESLLLSSHERKHLALMILLLILPHVPSSCVLILLSYKLVQCLIDILATKNSHLHETGIYFMKELNNWIGNDDERRVSVIVALQKHSSGRFDSITKTQTVKGLVAKFNTSQGCLQFVQNLASLFVDDGILSDEPSDQSQTTDENSEICTLEDKNSPGASHNNNIDTLKTWIINTMPRVLKNLKLDSNAKSLTDTEIVKFLEEKFRVQAEILKFLAVQGLFSASLGTEVTSFELEEKFKWPKSAISNSLCKLCIEQLQLLLEDAQKGEVSNVVLNGLEKNDLGSYFMCFLKTLCNIPSVSLYRTLSEKDQEAFKKLQETESRLLQEERKLELGVEEAHKLHALRYMLIHIELQVLLCPDEFNEAASELVICCQKAFPAVAADSEFEEEDAFDENETPDMMDVLLDTFLEVLPHSSSPMFFAMEQVFRLFSNDLTTDNIFRMLQVLMQNLKPLRHETYSSDDDDDDDKVVIGVEDLDEADNAKAIEANEKNAYTDNSEGKHGEVTKNEEVDSGAMPEDDPSSDNEETQKISSDSDNDDDVDDDEMLRRDAGIAKILQQRLSSGRDSTFPQLLTFKSRVLSLLEIFLQKHPGKSEVFMIYSYFVRTFVKYNSAKKPQLQQLGMRIKGILQKKIFKAKEHPNGDDILLTSLEPLVKKSLKSVSRSSNKEVSSLAQASTFWLLKVIQLRNFDKPELKKLVELFQGTLIDYFQSRKCRLKSGFIKEVIKRQPWIGNELFGFLLENCANINSEFRRTEVVEIIDCVMKSWTPLVQSEDASSKSTVKLLKKNMIELCGLIHLLLSNLPSKQARRAEVRRFCTRALNTVVSLNLRKQFLQALKPEAYSLCETHLGEAFLSLNAASQ